MCFFLSFIDFILCIFSLRVINPITLAQTIDSTPIYRIIHNDKILFITSNQSTKIKVQGFSRERLLWGTARVILFTLLKCHTYFATQYSYSNSPVNYLDNCLSVVRHFTEMFASLVMF